MKKLYRMHVSCITSKRTRENAEDLDNCHSNFEALKPGR